MIMCSYCTSVARIVLIVIDILSYAPLLCVPAACYCSLTFGAFYRSKYRHTLKIALQLGLKFIFPLMAAETLLQNMF